MTDQQQQDALDQLSINTLRLLAVDQVQKANSGHPGAPLGCAPIAYLLYHKIMKYNPTDPLWIGPRPVCAVERPRFGAAVWRAAPDRLRPADGAAEAVPPVGIAHAGHPEMGETPGVEVTTGPLGQGFAEAVGLAIAEKHLAAVYNHENHTPVDHHTYVLCGDGDLMEGISHESGVAGRDAGAGQADRAV